MDGKPKTFYFGSWDDPEAAERIWDIKKADIYAGRIAKPGFNTETTITCLLDLCNSFLDFKQTKLEGDELSKFTLDDYVGECKRIVQFFGRDRKLETIKPLDFDQYKNAMPSDWSAVTVNKHLRYARAVFQWANDTGVANFHYRLGLKAIPKKKVDAQLLSKAAKEFTAEEVHLLLGEASVHFRAFIMLGINCAYGSADIGRLKTLDVDFGTSWLGVRRGKTGVTRGCWLWPETVVALRDSFKKRPETDCPELDDLAFVTRQRRPYHVDGARSSPVATTFARIKKNAGIHKVGVAHYSLRHTFATIADNARDPHAVDFVMGHKDPSISARYREGIDPERIIAVCQHVRTWFLAGAPSC